MYCLRLLGGLTLEGPCGPLSGRVTQRRRLALLALLGAAGERGASRDRLTAHLWPESTDCHARHSLSDSLYIFNKDLSELAVLSAGNCLRLNPKMIACDVVTFEAALAAGDLDSAVALYSGSFLEGFYLGAVSGEFETWVEAERRRLANEYSNALESLAEAAESGANYCLAAKWWRKLAAHDPYGSRVAMRLMKALAAQGDPANALEVGRLHESCLLNDLGVEPPQVVRALAADLKSALKGAGELPGKTGARDRSDRVDGEALPLPPPPERESAQPSQTLLRRMRRPALFAGGAAVFVAAAWFVITGRGEHSTIEAAAEHDPNRIFVLPFSFRGADEHSYLGESMVHLLSVTLDGAGELRVVGSRTVLHALGGDDRSAADPRMLADRFGAGRYVSGAIVEVDGRLRIGARVIDIRETPRVIATANIGGRADDIQLFSLVNDLSGQLLIQLTGSPGTRLNRLAAVTTDSITALKAFLSGEVLQRHGHVEQAIDLFRRAVEIDSTFALAWYRLAWVTSDLTWDNWDRAIEAAERAVRHSGRLRPRDRSVLEAFAALLMGDGDTAERLYRKALTWYPNEAEALFGLVWAVSFYPLHGRSLEHGREYWQRLAKLEPESRRVRNLLLHIEAHVGNWQVVDSLLARQYPSGQLPLFWRTVRALGRNDQKAQRQIAETLEANDIAHARLSTRVGWYSKNPASGEALAITIFESSRSAEVRAQAKLQAAQSAVAQGRWRAAKAHLSALAPLVPSWTYDYHALWSSASFSPVEPAVLRALRDSIARPRPSDLSRLDLSGNWPAVFTIHVHDGVRVHLRPYLMGRLSARLGEHDVALRHAADLENIPPPAAAPTFSHDLAQGVRAMVFHARGHWEKALEASARARHQVRTPWFYLAPYFSGPEERYLRGEILVATGRDDEAIRWFDTIGIFPYDLPYLAPAHVRRAEIYQRLGMHEEAARHYTRFIELWKDGDPEFQPQVEKARRALAALPSDT